jgi:hypothetical protein
MTTRPLLFGLMRADGRVRVRAAGMVLAIWSTASAQTLLRGDREPPVFPARRHAAARLLKLTVPIPSDQAAAGDPFSGRLIQPLREADRCPPGTTALIPIQTLSSGEPCISSRTARAQTGKPAIPDLNPVRLETIGLRTGPETF